MSISASLAPRRLQVIVPGTTALGMDDLWQFRELLFFLAWRDIQLRYKQTALGAAWAVLQPLTAMLVFSLVFGRLAGFERGTGGVPYSLFALAGLLPWMFFSAALAASSGSIVANAGLITKVFFPRAIIPLAAMGAPLLDFAVGSIVLAGFIGYHGLRLTSGLGWSFVALVLLLATTAGLGTFFGALSVKYRDFKHVIPFMLQIGLFATPVAYPMSVIPARWLPIASLNPLAGIVDAFRAGVLGLPIDKNSLMMSALLAATTLFVGFFYFRRVERQLADVI